MMPIVNNRVLLATDDTQIGSLITAVLRREGYRTVIERTAEAALNGLLTQSYDLAIFTSQTAPVSGVEAVVRLLQQGCETPLILTSGRCTESEVPANGPRFVFLPKPFTPVELLDVVSRILDP
jgi:DNA-binding response OmpR family regulator